MPASPRASVALPGCLVDLEQRSAWRAGQAHVLTTLEARLLRYLADRPGEVVPRSELYEQVWGYAAGVRSRALGTTLSRLRAKVGPAVRTVVGAGLTLEVSAGSAAPTHVPALDTEASVVSVLGAGASDAVLGWAASRGAVVVEPGAAPLRARLADAMGIDPAHLTVVLEAVAPAVVVTGPVSTHAVAQLEAVRWRLAPPRPLGLRREVVVEAQALEASSAPPTPTASAGRLRLGDREVDLLTGDLTVDGAVTRLPARAAAVLRVLAEAEGAPVSRADLMHQIWADAPRSRVVDWTVRALRRAVEADPRRPAHVLTVTGTGYRLVAEPAGAGLPVAPWPLVGRTQLLARIHAAVCDESVVVLTGPGGVGKSAVALEVARHHAGRWVDLSASVGALAALADALGPRPLSQLQALAGVLVVLDAAEATPGLTDLLPQWREAAPEARWLITTRGPLGIEGCVIDVPPLPSDEALDLLGQLARRRGAPHDSALLTRVLERTEGLPLALELAAASLAHTTAPADAPPRQRSMHATLAWTWERLDPGLRDLLAAVAVFAGPFDEQAAAAVAGDGDVTAGLLGLSTWGMLQTSTTSRLLDVVRQWVRTRAPAPEAWRRLDRWLRRASEDDRAAQPWLSDIVGALERGRADPDVAVTWCLDVHRTLLARGWLDLHERLVDRALAGARTPDERARALHAVGLRLQHRGDLIGARPVLEEARAEAELAQSDVLAQVCHALARAVAAQGDLPAARQLLDEALARAHGTQRASIQTSRSIYALLAGERDRALALLREAETEGTPSVRAHALANLSTHHGLAGDWTQAIGCAARAVEAYGEVGEVGPQAIALDHLGLWLLGAGRTREAADTLRRAVAAAARAQDRQAEGSARANLADALLELGDTSKARGQLRRALRRLGGAEVRMQAEAWLALGALELQAGRLQEASASLAQCREIEGAEAETHHAAALLQAVVDGADPTLSLTALALEDRGRQRVVARALRAAARTASRSRT